MKYLVIILPKDEVLDPQGEVILDAAHSLGFKEIASIRAGKSFLVEINNGEDSGRLNEIADKLLSNPLVETFSIQALTPLPEKVRNN